MYSTLPTQPYIALECILPYQYSTTLHYTVHWNVFYPTNTALHCTTRAVLLLQYFVCCTSSTVILLLYYFCCTSSPVVTRSLPRPLFLRTRSLLLGMECPADRDHRYIVYILYSTMLTLYCTTMDIVLHYNILHDIVLNPIVHDIVLDVAAANLHSPGFYSTKLSYTWCVTQNDFFHSCPCLGPFMSIGLCCCNTL